MTMTGFFHVYQFLGPATLMPLAAYGWWRHYDGDWNLAAVALLVPVIHAYIVPGIGTNVLGMWAFNTRLKLGKFRPHHGFVFGSATALIALMCIGAPSPQLSAGTVLSTALLIGAVLLAVNWVYDALALKSGVLEVYNQPWANGAGPWAISGDYVIWFFGVFGVIYGAGLRLAESVLLVSSIPLNSAALTALIVAATLIIPTLGYIATSWLRHGHSGCRPRTQRTMEARTS